ncbi:MAG: class I SAM-dependent methyltransferase [Nitrososphaera sp.]
MSWHILTSEVYDPVSYKIGTIRNWDLVAQTYHDKWASRNVGPFQATAELIRAARIQPGDTVLDIGCGTGAALKAASQSIDHSGMFVGTDISHAALSIARSYLTEAHFAQMDAENIGINARVDKVLCQYALMFFPNPSRVLRAVRTLMKYTGVLAILVHGNPEGVPYFSTIMEPVLRHIPDIRPQGTPTVHRFGSATALEKEISDAGFLSVSVRRLALAHNAGTFEEYWSDYLSTTALSIRDKIESNSEKLLLIKSEAERTSRSFSGKDGTLTFPWEVLIATALRC